MTYHSVEPKEENMPKHMDFCHLQEIYPGNLRKKLIYTATKTGIYAAQTAFKKVFNKTAEATGELVGKTVAKIVKPKPMPEANPKNAEKIFYLKKKQTNKLGQVLYNWTPQNIEIIKQFNHIKVCVKKMHQSKWFIQWPILCQQECKI